MRTREGGLWWIVVALAGVLGAARDASAQATMVFSPDRDNTIYEDVLGGASNGAGDHIFAGRTNNGQKRRALVRFDLSLIPPGSTIVSASLRLHLSQARTDSGNQTVTLHRCLSDWGEGASDAEIGEGGGAGPIAPDATWIHRKYPDQFWTAVAGDFVSAPSASAVVGTVLDTYHTWSGAGVVANVQQWVNDGSGNFGWFLVGAEGAARTAKRFDSRENDTVAYRPQLTVTFNPPPGAGACCLASGDCLVTLPANCATISGSFSGVGTLCTPNPCPQPIGVCCLPSGACQEITPPQCASLGGDYRGENVTCAVVSCPIPLEKFVDALPIPAVATPTTGVAGGAAHYDIAVREFWHTIHRDLPATRMWGYNGTYPGPTISTRKGQAVTVRWSNDLRDVNGVLRTTHMLPVDTCLHGPDVTGQVPRHVTHLHGAKVGPESDGFPEATIAPGQQAPIYTYPNDQQAATLWYHDHALGLTRLNVYMGIAGFYLLRDNAEDALPLPRGEYEVPLIIQDKSFNGDGTLRYNSLFSDSFLGDTIIVNGKAWPFMNVKRTKYRFRIVNGSGSRTYTLSLSNNGQFQQIMSDGGLLAAPVSLNSVTLMPSERADIVIDFAPLSPGTEVILRNSAPAPFPGTPGVGVIPDVMKFIVQPEFGPAVFLPGTLASVPRTPEAQATVTREFRLKQVFEPTCGYNMWTINGLLWDDITEFPRINDTEIWSFVNISAISHPLHVHLVQFQVLDRQDFFLNGNDIVPNGPRQAPPPEESGWKDSVQVRPGQITRVIAKFEGFAGTFSYHCHFLEHEDHEMMRQFTVLCDPPSIVTPPQALTVAENATAQFSVGAAGDALAYRWRRNGVPMNNGAQIGGSVVSGVTTPTLTIATPDPRDNAAYTCALTSPCGQQTTVPVNLIVTPACPGDLSFDGAVNTTDLSLFLASFGKPVQPGTNGDLNNDGVVNTSDLALFLARFGRPC